MFQHDFVVVEVQGQENEAREEGELLIHPARMSGRRVVQYVAQYVACAALTLAGGGVRIHPENARLSDTVCGTMRSTCGADAGLLAIDC